MSITPSTPRLRLLLADVLGEPLDRGVAPVGLLAKRGQDDVVQITLQSPPEPLGSPIAGPTPLPDRENPRPE